MSLNDCAQQHCKFADQAKAPELDKSLRYQQRIISQHPLSALHKQERISRFDTADVKVHPLHRTLVGCGGPLSSPLKFLSRHHQPIFFPFNASPCLNEGNKVSEDSSKDRCEKQQAALHHYTRSAMNC